MDIACSLGALPPADRAAHVQLARELFAESTFSRAKNEVHATLPASELVRVATFLSVERKCCPFVKFTIELEPEAATLTIRASGSEEAIAVFMAEVEAMLHQGSSPACYL